MKYIGAHVSVAGGVGNAPVQAHAIVPRPSRFSREAVRVGNQKISRRRRLPIQKQLPTLRIHPGSDSPHDNFLINLGSPDSKKLAMSRKSFLDEMRRCMQLGLTMLNFHPGSHLNAISEEECLDRIAESVNMTLEKTEGVIAVLENVAGQGSNIAIVSSSLPISLTEWKTKAESAYASTHAMHTLQDSILPLRKGMRKLGDCSTP